MTPDFSLTDRTTWIAILTVVAAILSDVFHQSFAAYVPAAATVAAGLVVGIVALAKHHYAAALESIDAAATAATPQLPTTGELHYFAQRIGNALADAGAVLGATAPSAAATAAPAAPVAQPALAAPSAAPPGV